MNILADEKQCLDHTEDKNLISKNANSNINSNKCLKHTQAKSASMISLSQVRPPITVILYYPNIFHHHPHLQLQHHPYIFIIFFFFFISVKRIGN